MTQCEKSNQKNRKVAGVVTQKTNVLVINCGSSSIKFALIDTASGEQIVSGLAERLGEQGAMLNWKVDGHKDKGPIPGADHAVAMRHIAARLEEVTQALYGEPVAARLRGIGHRVVHGGEAFTASTIIDESVLATVEACNHLAPLHNPANLLGIRTAQALFPDLPQVAVFDTAFHQTLPRHAYLYAVPYDYYTELGVRRYGFHGTSHRYVTQQAAQFLGKPYTDCALVSAHLGNGCSAAAVLNGHSVDTTMGLTPLEGLVMGTRSGDVDPSLHSFLAGALGLSLTEITDILNKKSGMLGLSGLSNDLRTLEDAAAEGNDRAIMAIEVFCYRLAKQIAGLAVGLAGKIDALVFTGGIGENSPLVRSKTVGHLAVLGFQLDPVLNDGLPRGGHGRINQPNSPAVLVIPTDEELMIAQDTAGLIM